MRRGPSVALAALAVHIHVLGAQVVPATSSVAMPAATMPVQPETTTASTAGPTPVAPIAPFASRAAASDDVMHVPFAVGETAQYDVKFGVLHVGSANTTVADTEALRGRSVWHTVFRVKGGTFFYHVDDVFESWIDQATFSSLRFYQTQREGRGDRNKRYEIFPEKGMYIEEDKTPPRTHEGVKDPLDDGSFLFFVRTVPLTVGTTYESNRYFRPERNPVRIRVLRTETIQVPAGTFKCIVVQPVIQTAGIFSENGHAEVWLSDDARRIVVQIKSRLSFGSLNLYLKSYQAGKASSAGP